MDLFNKEVEYYEELSCQQKHRWLEYRLNYLGWVIWVGEF